MVTKPVGAQPWAILQVVVQPTPAARPGAFNPNRTLPNNLQLSDLFTGPSAKGDLPADLWARLSFGRLSIAGSQVFGPFDAIRQDGMRATTDDWDNMNDDEAANKFDRGQKVLSGIRGAVKAGIDLTPFWGVVVVPDYQIDSFGGYGQVAFGFVSRGMGQALLDYNDFSCGRLMHEMGHGFGFEHTRGDFNPDPGGDYGDPGDIMSFARCRSYTGTDGATGPGFSAASLWCRGWLPADVQVISSSSGFADATYTLSSLYASPLAPGTSRALVLDVDRTGRYVDRELYFVEFRDNKGIDQGLPKPAVFIRRVRSIKGEWENSPWLVGPNASSPARDAVGLVAGGAGWVDPEAGFGVGVVAIDGGSGTATVQIIPSRSTITVEETLETLDEEVTGFGVDTWGNSVFATSSMCRESHEDEYEVLSRSQRLTLKATPAGGLEPLHAVVWLIEGIPVNASGPVSFPITYEGNPFREVTLDVEVNGQTMVLRNRPSDGLIKFYVEVNAQPAVPGVGRSVTNLQFDGAGRRYYDSQHDANVTTCAEETADALREKLGHRLHRGPVKIWEPGERLGESDVEQIINVLQERVGRFGPDI